MMTTICPIKHMQFEYKGFRFGISSFRGEYHFYTEKMLKKGKPQQQLQAKNLNKALLEVKSIIDNHDKAKKSRVP